MILYASDDLIWASRIRAAADAAGLTALRIHRVEDLDCHLKNPGILAILIDIADMVTAKALLEHLASLGSCRTYPIVAFGPHVDADSLNEARAKGADQVFSRATMTRKLSSMVSQWARQNKPT